MTGVHATTNPEVTTTKMFRYITLISFIGLTTLACTSKTLPVPQQPQVAAIELPPASPIKDEVVVVVVVEEVETVEVAEVQVERDPRDYYRLSDLIHRETRGKCMCTSGDPFCRCKLANGPKKLPKE